MNDINPNVFVNFVLDKSGSMGSVRQATIEGFNAFVAEQRNQPGEAKLSLTLFDTAFDIRHVGLDLREVPDLGTTASPYIPGGGTSLLDAVGTTIKGTEQWLLNNPTFDGKVVCVILTDGQENGSREWHIFQPLVPGDDHDLGGLIQYKQAEGWEFIFLGSGGANWLERTFGHVVDHQNFHAYAHDAVSSVNTYAGVSRSLTSTRTKGGSFAANTSDELKDNS